MRSDDVVILYLSNLLENILPDWQYRPPPATLPFTGQHLFINQQFNLYVRRIDKEYHLLPTNNFTKSVIFSDIARTYGAAWIRIDLTDHNHNELVLRDILGVKS